MLLVIYENNFIFAKEITNLIKAYILYLHVVICN